MANSTDVELRSNCLYIAKEVEEAYNNGELYEYLEDVLDIEYTIDSRFNYIGCRLAIALGGPSIYINTRDREIVGYWGVSICEIGLDTDICSEIDSIFEEQYEAR